MDDYDYNELLSFIRNTLSIDGTLYKEKPFRRRITLRMKYTDCESYSDYLDYVRNNPDEMNKLKDALTINVTRFFRNRETFDYLRDYISMNMIKYKSKINILSVGCSSGEEPYTLAIIMDEINRKTGVQYSITGVDVDENMIQRAKAGSYNEFSFTEVRSEERDRYFRKIGELYFIEDSLKTNVNFKIMDIKNQLILKKLGQFDIIMCRNVLIYFGKEFQDRIIESFNNMLPSGGIMVLGKIEILTGNTRQLFTIINKRERVYTKIDNQN